MSLYKRKDSPHWWVRFTHNGRRIQQSAGTADRIAAQQFHDKLKAELWEQQRLGVKPRRTWNEAVVQFLKETTHKATHQEDIRKLRWLDRFLRDLHLDNVTRELVNQIGEAKARESSPASANRYLALIRTILRRAAFDWEWMDRPPKVRLFKERSRRVRWLTRDQVDVLLNHLPEHLAEMVRFSLATGLRQSNVTGLEWSQIDMSQHAAWIHPDQAKARKAIAVPLNDEALAVLRRQLGRHQVRVFTYQRKARGARPGNPGRAFEARPVNQVNTKAWKKALARAGIEDFRWHDLRHTWASWHVQAGTSMHELQELGGWETPEMVRRYAHLAPAHLAKAASNIVPLATKLATSTKRKGVA